MVQPAASSEAECQPAGPLLDQARSVGREFVYIYYTCVNKCPQNLHLFYSTGSHFVHGGRELSDHAAEPPAVGQADIAARVEQLGLADCRTKILMVDSLPAPAKGVLIQVCGEISNNAGPMRRFMQTFLLAPVGPKKYFVLNDIFRYQDEVFTDADDVTDTSNGIVADGDEPGVDAADVAATAPPVAETGDANGVSSGDEGNEADEVVAAVDTADGTEEAVGEPPLEPAAVSEQLVAVEKEDEVEEKSKEQPATAVDEVAETAAPSCVPKETPVQPPPPSGKRNFAALFSNGQQQQQQQQQAPRRQLVAAAAPQSNGGSGADSGPIEELRRGDREAPDHLQVFVGNLLPEVHESDLVEAFRQYGEVTGCRITAGKPRPGVATVANFGFVTFANAAGVKAAVEMPPTVKGFRVNVEEKKPGGFRRGGGGGRGGYRGGGYSSGSPYPRR